MKLAMALTLEGLVRALRGRLHVLAEEVEAGYRRDTPERKARRPRRSRKARGESNDVARR